MPRQKTDRRAAALRDLIGARLTSRASMSSVHWVEAAHLDEDQLSAFVEGRLGEAESASLVAHLVSCATCRRVTAELVRLQFVLRDEEQTELTLEREEPGRIRRLLEDLASRVIHTHEEVMAYHAPAEDLEQEEKRSDAESKAATEQPADSHSSESDETKDENQRQL